MKLYTTMYLERISYDIPQNCEEQEIEYTSEIIQVTLEGEGPICACESISNTGESDDYGTDWPCATELYNLESKGYTIV